MWPLGSSTTSKTPNILGLREKILANARVCFSKDALKRHPLQNDNDPHENIHLVISTLKTDRAPMYNAMLVYHEDVLLAEGNWELTVVKAPSQLLLSMGVMIQERLGLHFMLDEPGKIFHGGAEVNLKYLKQRDA
ncbi:uncharacterized protein CLAFUR5_09373 [Fulvia fulva]|uniref:Uncharacterized protein n=1 Tax=Passalora fulva TaxID=5499 RepID=A0A9Q8PH92_PASFU|nr:uncharacterized protein CLAFUR5_09373 [Fulvia fulva]UJO22385.1 hypothetical protein CLAFUR5_09373 [Fulvia fulva]